MSLFYNPVKIYFESEDNEKIKEIIKELDDQRVLIITWNQRIIESESSILSSSRAQKKVIEFSRSNPDLQDLLLITNEIQDFEFDCVIAIGGGSVIDTAKSLIALKHMSFKTVSDLRHIIANEAYEKDLQEIPLLAIPTTSGTGSEVTPWGTIWDKELNKKYSISDPKLFAKYALILPSLTMELPRRATISTALDALCHATEAYWSKQSNPVSRVFSIKAIELILEQLERSDFELGKCDLREKLSLASVMAGLSFSNTKTTACHAISYPLTLKFNIDHGIAVSLTLGKILEKNQEEIVELPQLLAAFQVENVTDVQKKMVSIFEKFGIKHQLTDYHIKKSDLTYIASHSFTKGRMDNNPVDLSTRDIESLLASIL